MCLRQRRGGETRCTLRSVRSRHNNNSDVLEAKLFAHAHVMMDLRRPLKDDAFAMAFNGGLHRAAYRSSKDKQSNRNRNHNRNSNSMGAGAGKALYERPHGLCNVAEVEDGGLKFVRKTNQEKEDAAAAHRITAAAAAAAAAHANTAGGAAAGAAGDGDGTGNDYDKKNVAATSDGGNNVAATPGAGGARGATARANIYRTYIALAEEAKRRVYACPSRKQGVRQDAAASSTHASSVDDAASKAAAAKAKAAAAAAAAAEAAVVPVPPPPPPPTFAENVTR